MNPCYKRAEHKLEALNSGKNNQQNPMNLLLTINTIWPCFPASMLLLSWLVYFWTIHNFIVPHIPTSRLHAFAMNTLNFLWHFCFLYVDLIFIMKCFELLLFMTKNCMLDKKYNLEKVLNCFCVFGFFVCFHIMIQKKKHIKYLVLFNIITFWCLHSCWHWIQDTLLRLFSLIGFNCSHGCLFSVIEQ